MKSATSAHAFVGVLMQVPPGTVAEVVDEGLVMLGRQRRPGDLVGQYSHLLVLGLG